MRRLGHRGDDGGGRCRTGSVGGDRGHRRRGGGRSRGQLGVEIRSRRQHELARAARSSAPRRSSPAGSGHRAPCGSATSGGWRSASARRSRRSRRRRRRRHAEQVDPDRADRAEHGRPDRRRAAGATAARRFGHRRREPRAPTGRRARGSRRSAAAGRVASRRSTISAPSSARMPWRSARATSGAIAVMAGLGSGHRLFDGRHGQRRRLVDRVQGQAGDLRGPRAVVVAEHEVDLQQVLGGGRLAGRPDPRVRRQEAQRVTPS